MNPQGFRVKIPKMFETTSSIWYRIGLDHLTTIFKMNVPRLFFCLTRKTSKLNLFHLTRRIGCAQIMKLLWRTCLELPSSSNDSILFHVFHSAHVDHHKQIAELFRYFRFHFLPPYLKLIHVSKGNVMKHLPSDGQLASKPFTSTCSQPYWWSLQFLMQTLLHKH